MVFAALESPQPRLALFAPPYDHFVNVDRSWRPLSLPPLGLTLIWWLADSARQESDFQWLHDRPPGLPLVVVLPPAREIHRTLPLLNYLSALEPRAVLPTGRLVTPVRLRRLLTVSPQPFPAELIRYLAHRHLLRETAVLREVKGIIERAPNVTSVTQLAGRLHMSRRTLGRHFESYGLPVPSHWLQLGRLLPVALRLQSNKMPISRAAVEANYPDGFTMSNQMKRLFGFRPSKIRRLLGWEWILELWIRREAETGGFDVQRYGDSIRPYLHDDSHMED